MFKIFNRCISLLVIISLLFPDVLNAMNEPENVEKRNGIKLSIQDSSSEEIDIEEGERQPLLKEKKSSQELSNKKKSSPLTCFGKPILPQHRDYFRPLKREPLLSVRISLNEEERPSQKRPSLLEKGDSSDDEEEDDHPVAPPPSPFLSTEVLVKKEERDPSHLLLKIGVDQALQKQNSRSTSPLSPQISPRRDGVELETSSSSSLQNSSSGHSSDNDLSPSSQNNSPPTQNTVAKPQQEGQVLEEGKIKDEKSALVPSVDSGDKKSPITHIEEKELLPPEEKQEKSDKQTIVYESLPAVPQASKSFRDKKEPLGECEEFELIPINAAANGNASHPPADFLKFLEENPKTKFQLLNYRRQIIEENSTNAEKGITAAAFLLAGWHTGIAGPIYTGSFLSIKQTPFLKELLSGNGLLCYIAISGFPPLWAQNNSALQQAFHYLTEEEEKEWGRITLAFIASLPAAIIDMFCLISPELIVMKVLGWSGIHNQSARLLLGFCPVVFTNGIIGNFSSSWQMMGSAQKGWKKLRAFISHKLFHQALSEDIKSDATLAREDFEKKLKRLSKFLFRASEEDIERIDREIEEIKASAPLPSEADAENSKAFQTFNIFLHLFSLGDQLQKGKKHITSIYETLTDWLNYSCLVLGSPTRLLVLEYMWETIFGIFCPPLVAKILGWSLGVGSFPLQTGAEWQGMKSLFRNFFWHESPYDYSSHPGLRSTAKTYSIVQGVILLLPLFAVALLASTGSWWQAASIPFFLVPELGAQTGNLQLGYTQQSVTLMTKGYNMLIRKKIQSKPPCFSCKRDRLVRLVQEAQGKVRMMAPEFLFLFQETLKNTH